MRNIVIVGPDEEIKKLTNVFQIQQYLAQDFSKCIIYTIKKGF